jgi:alkylation response protein AidB-like acyl-CoA dehydrogenase
MFLELTDEQRILRDTVRRFLLKEIVPVASHLDRAGPLTKEQAHGFLRSLSPFGYLGSTIPEEAGGAGVTFLTYGILIEELRRAWASLGGVVGITASSARTIYAAGTPEQKERYLRPLLRAEIIGCSGLSEPDVGSDLSGIRTRAVRCDGGYRLSGTKMWISNGTIADFVIAYASTDPQKGGQGISRFIVDRRDSPFTVREIRKMGVRAFPTAEIVFEDCLVPEGSRIGAEGEAFKGALRNIQVARCMAAVSAVGIAQAAIDASIAYAKDREQFGKPIASFQLIQEMVAEMVTETEAARLLAYRALDQIDRGGKFIKEASMAKYFATEAAVRVTSKAIQIHGAYGLSEEFPVERYFRDARMYTVPDGTTEIQKLIIGREVLGVSAIT